METEQPCHSLSVDEMGEVTAFLFALVLCPDPTHVQEGLVTQVQILGLSSEFESVQ